MALAVVLGSCSRGFGLLSGGLELISGRSRADMVIRTISLYRRFYNIGGPCLSCPYKKSHTSLGFILGALRLGNSQIGDRGAIFRVDIGCSMGIHIHIHLYIRIYIYTYTHSHVHIYIYICIYDGPYQQVLMKDPCPLAQQTG